MTNFSFDIRANAAQALRASQQVQQSLQRISRQAEGVRSLITRAFAGIGTFLTARALVGLADDLQRVENRLRVVTSSQEELLAVQDALRASADRTRSSFAGAAELYARLALNAQELGRTQRELLQFTESLNQAIILSGASAQEAQAGLIQLSQGLASGALRGDELRSVLEQLPAVADIIARGLGVTRGELRKLGEQGEISAEAIFDAFAKARVELDERFGKTVPTVGQAILGLKDNFKGLVQELDRQTGAFDFLTNVIRANAEMFKLARERASNFRDTFAEVENEARLSSVGAAITNLNRELRALEQREIISEGAVQRAEQLRRQIEALTGAAKRAQAALPQGNIDLLSGIVPAVQGLQGLLKQAAGTVQEFTRAFDAKAQIDDIEAEAGVLRLLIAGRADLADALAVENSLRSQGIDLTDGERERLQVATATNQALAAQAQAMVNLVGQQQANRQETEALIALQRQHPELLEQIRQRLLQLQIAGLESSTALGDGFARALLKLKVEENDLAAVGESVVGVFADNLTNALVTLAETGSLSFKELARSILADLTQIIARLLVVQALSSLIGGGSNPLPALTGGGPGGIGPGAPFPGLAEGGPVLAGRSYIVGEGGQPEVFTPRQSGTVTPLSDLQPSAPPQVNVQVVNVQSEDEVASTINSGKVDHAIVNVLQRKRRTVQELIG